MAGAVELVFCSPDNLSKFSQYEASTIAAFSEVLVEAATVLGPLFLCRTVGQDPQVQPLSMPEKCGEDEMYLLSGRHRNFLVCLRLRRRGLTWIW